MEGDEKLTVVTLGALTNIASALLMDPSISSKIAVYWLGTTYDFEEDILRKRDFNCMMDPQALEEVLKSSVELHVIPVNIASKMTFNYAETEQKLRGKHGVLDFLVDRWYEHLDGSRYERTIWDLSIIEAIIHPEWVEEVKIMTTKENYSRPVYYYKDIDADKIRAAFFDIVLTHLAGK